MTVNRSALRRLAKKVYKENVKKVPKQNRIPFAQFYKKYKELKDAGQVSDVETVDTENKDFDFDDLVNVNTIDDDSLDTNDED